MMAGLVKYRYSFLSYKQTKKYTYNYLFHRNKFYYSHAKTQALKVIFLCINIKAPQGGSIEEKERRYRIKNWRDCSEGLVNRNSLV
jgi:hypothetical protein